MSLPLSAVMQIVYMSLSASVTGGNVSSHHVSSEMNRASSLRLNTCAGGVDKLASGYSPLLVVPRDVHFELCTSPAAVACG